jgi:hypothetical protein
MADLRFQFVVNGQVICTAGVEGFGVFSSTFSWVKRTADSYAKNKTSAPPDWDTTLEEWTREEMGIAAGGQDSQFPGHASWFDHELHVGDEVTIRILGPGPIDSPKHIVGPQIRSE